MHSSTRVLYQYTLTTAGDITTATYASKSFNTGSQDTSPKDVFFKTDGTEMYVLGTTNDVVSQYTLSTAWDISTASYTTNKSVSSESTSHAGLAFSSDGTKMYVLDDGNNSVDEYSLSTAWTVSTASYSSTFALGYTDSWYGLAFKDDGTSFFSFKNSGKALVEYVMSTAWDTSTAAAGVTYSLTGGSTAYREFVFLDSAKKLASRNATNTQYDEFSIITPTTITWPTSIEWAGGVSPAAPANGETDLFSISTDDGGTTYQGFKTADNLS